MSQSTCFAGIHALVSGHVEFRDAPERGVGIRTSAQNDVQPRRETFATAERTAVLNVPVITDQAQAGNVKAEISATDILRASAYDLRRVLGSRINEEVSARLLALGADLVPIYQVRQAGIDLRFDTAKLAIIVDIPLAARGAQTFRSGIEPKLAGLEVVEPADVSAGVTLASFTSGDLVTGQEMRSELTLRGFANLGGPSGANLLYGADVSTEGNFRRDRLVAFIDDPSKVLRYSAGDILPTQSLYGSNFDLFGVSLQRSYQELQPVRNVRPLGRRSFLLERPALIEIYVNGALLRSFNANAGPIDIEDIPVAELSNEVSIVIQDATGRREVDNFTLGNDINLLDQGLSEFAFSAGLLRDNRVSGLSYTSQPVASLFLTTGATDRLTIGGSAVLTERLQGFGAIFAFAGLGGVTQLDAAVSRDGAGMGGAVTVAYRGTPIDLGFGPAQTNLRAEYRTEDFRTLANFGFVDDIRLDLAADVRANLSQKLQMVIGGSFISRYGADQDRYGVFGGLQVQLGTLNLGATARYLRLNPTQDQASILFTMSRMLGRRSNIFGTFDTATGRGRAEFRRLRPLTLPELEFGARAEVEPEAYSLGGRFGFANSRFEALFDTQQNFRLVSGNSENRSSLRIQTAIGFADGSWGIGRDTSRGFVMVKKHPSLADSEIRVSTGSAGRELGYSNGLGPALVPVLIPFRPQELRIAADNAPIGYNIGAGEYVAMPSARSGVVISVGSDAYHTGLAVLTTFDGQPLGLVTGRIIQVETGLERSFFTNRAGRAVFTQLAPGTYRGLVDGNQFEFEFNVPKDAPGSISLGTLKLEHSR